MPVSLLDIAPPEVRVQEIDFRGDKLRIQGIRAQDWAMLYERFPRLRDVIEGRNAEASALENMRMQGAVIAAATGHPNEEEWENAALYKLDADEANRIMLAAIQLSLPGDVFGPLLDGAADRPSGPSEPMMISPSPFTNSSASPATPNGSGG